MKTRDEFIKKINELTGEIKALYPEGYARGDGSTYADGIQERADFTIAYMNATQIAFTWKTAFGRFEADCDSFRRIATKKAAKGWPKNG
jgi:hypothetical protein